MRVTRLWYLLMPYSPAGFKVEWAMGGHLEVVIGARLGRNDVVIQDGIGGHMAFAFGRPASCETPRVHMCLKLRNIIMMHTVRCSFPSSQLPIPVPFLEHVAILRCNVTQTPPPPAQPSLTPFP